MNEQTGEMPVEFSRRELVAFVTSYGEAKEIASAADRVKKHTSSLIKAYLEAHPDETLRDGESGWEAALSRRTVWRYDTTCVSEELVLALWRAGALTVDADALKTADAGLAGLAHRHRVPGEAVAISVVKHEGP